MTSVLAAAIVLFAPQITAAEIIYFTYSPFQFSVSVSALETFAQSGAIEPGLGQLGRYLSRLNSEQQMRLQTLLKNQFEVDLITISRLFYTRSGERILQYFGNLITSKGGRNGLQDIRSALVLAAVDPEGLTAINFLQKLSTDVQIDVRRVLQVIQQVTDLIQQTDARVAALEQSTRNTVSESEITSRELLHSNFSQLPDLRQSGRFQVAKQTLNLRDQSRDRELPTDFYRPNSPEAPVIVISGGLGARRDRFAALAEHLASHGFAVAIPDHPGSNAQRNRDFFAGLYRFDQENFDAAEYVDRPLDVTFLLNELEQLNVSQFNHQLNLQQTGIFGYSFGGATALSLAGARINFDQLEADCGSQINLLNISVLYQCRALELPRERFELRDDRIQAAFVFVPFSNSIFGQAGMRQVTVPVFWQATEADVITPLLLEQIPAFSGLDGSDHYFIVSKELPHTRITLNLTNELLNRDVSLEDAVRVTQTYLNAWSLAFFKVYVSQIDEYRSYLQAAYAQALSEEPYQLSFVQSLPPAVSQ
jgi:predicted dienelactone hydrolase